MNDLTVWCVCVGTKYPNYYVLALRDMVVKHLTIPYEFKCITPRKIPGVICVPPHVPYQGWWGKINLFSPGMAVGPSIYFDLDVVITGNLDYLADYTEGRFAAPANWAQSGHGGIQSSVMAWPGNWHAPFHKIKPLWLFKQDLESGHTMLGGRPYWGDQEFIGAIVGDDWDRLPGIGSYKYHVMGKNIPDWMRVCVFHGQPKPHEVSDKCMLPFTSILRSHINASKQSGSRQDLSASA